MLDSILYIAVGAAVVGLILLVIGKMLKKDDSKLIEEAISQIK